MPKMFAVTDATDAAIDAVAAATEAFATDADATDAGNVAKVWKTTICQWKRLCC